MQSIFRCFEATGIEPKQPTDYWKRMPCSHASRGLVFLLIHVSMVNNIEKSIKFKTTNENLWLLFFTIILNACLDIGASDEASRIVTKCWGTFSFRKFRNLNSSLPGGNLRCLCSITFCHLDILDARGEGEGEQIRSEKNCVVIDFHLFCLLSIRISLACRPVCQLSPLRLSSSQISSENYFNGRLII